MAKQVSQETGDEFGSNDLMTDVLSKTAND